MTSGPSARLAFHHAATTHPAAHSQPRGDLHTPRSPPSPHAQPELAIQGPFSLEPLSPDRGTGQGLPGVGIRVDGHVVFVMCGTLVYRGFGMGEMGREGKELWWEGQLMEGGRPGVWTLGLIG